MTNLSQIGQETIACSERLPLLIVKVHRQIYLTQFPFIVLFSPTYFALAHKGTHNYLPGYYTDTYNIAEWWCDKGKC